LQPATHGAGPEHGKRNAARQPGLDSKPAPIGIRQRLLTEGNRYDIPNISALDKKTQIYLAQMMLATASLFRLDRP
jgi:hypothetical protein